MYVPEVVSGAKISRCPWCNDEVRCDDNDFINVLTFLSSLSDKADTKKSKLYPYKN